MYNLGGKSLFKVSRNGNTEYVDVYGNSSEENVGKTTTDHEAEQKTTFYILSQF